MGKPGIMMYFEIYPCLEMMTRAEKGDLLEAMMLYGMTGETPKLSGNIKMLWPLLKDRVDRDTNRYNRVVIRNQYASYAKTAAKNGEEKLSYEQWLERNYPNGYQLEDNADQWEE